MKTLLFITTAFSLLMLPKLFGQQCLTGGCSNFTNQYPSGTLTPTSSWQTQNAMNAGNWTLFNVTCGNTYDWTYCENYGGVSSSWDAQLTLYNNTNLSAPLCFSTDQCGTNGNGPFIRWQATFTGIARILTTVYIGNQGCLSNTGSPYNRIAFRIYLPGNCCTAVSVNTQPSNQTTCEGTSATFMVTASGTPPFTFIWFKGTTLVQSTTVNGYSNTYTTPPLLCSDNGSNYSCSITNCSPVVGVNSNTAALTVNCLPSAPTGLTLINTGCNNVFLSWNPVVGAGINYEVLKNNTSCSAAFGSSGLGPTSTTSGSVNTNPGTQYYFVVTATNTCGMSPNSNCVNTLTQILPSQPSLITGNPNPCPGASEIYSISPVQGANSYNWTLPSGWTGNSNTPLISTIVGSSGGVISVSAGNSCGNSTPTNKLITINCAATSLNELSNISDFIIYPNPSNGIFSFEFQDPILLKNLQMEIYNQIGELVFSSVILNPKTTIKLNKTSAGIYFLKLIHNNQISRHKKIIIE